MFRSVQTAKIYSSFGFYLAKTSRLMNLRGFKLAADSKQSYLHIGGLDMAVLQPTIANSKKHLQVLHIFYDHPVQLHS